MGITESRVSQIRTQAIIRLRTEVGGEVENAELEVLLSKRAV